MDWRRHCTLNCLESAKKTEGSSGFGVVSKVELEARRKERSFGVEVDYDSPLHVWHFSPNSHESPRPQDHTARQRVSAPCHHTAKCRANASKFPGISWRVIAARKKYLFTMKTPPTKVSQPVFARRNDEAIYQA